ncbi:Uncharacterized conserved protein, Ntn-hydrolase superfamily [Saccharopolyspora kobensis]|uniref:Uncharacterized conserved protein, Ntn-hydrolase superfamily n=1 Tax=Saccharopolyspora kobensis TaxID=146035 RepID=A0A1H6AKW1_9PSEU|nr:DUF1028 domain-containing protein [Saccharopolyspora kobensis]SEG48665.1 Uncharacterized conserved protein, Ntn-hydrolase superfamily [Saccharopolyspora kobensis]SFE58189.1 Uncharacterized conserved protein, Ntn-hydrolase superfamily [Saccharopolyspora kobensis]
MTFSIAARQDGRFGMAVSSSSPAVAARCLHLRPNVGAAASQNITDPRLGGRILDRLAAHGDAPRALREVGGDATDLAYRQLSAVGPTGPAAWFSGEHTLGTHGAAVGAHSVAAGNLLSSTEIPAIMVAAFESATGELEERLLTAMQAAVAAGGEEGPVHSAGLAVVADVEWPVTDLRVDWAEDPIDRLAEALEIWLPQRDDYVRRGLQPSAAPSYGVPGDL